ncbi:MAG: ribonuclease HI family protein [Candidatus Omnitrophica bacterium]|nr:ribonuclease HI family protein [Candidatus Omnitrophota bacterium]
MRQFEIYIDGASKGNPGHAGIGVIICQDGQVLRNISSYIGKATNNVAEYTALIYALQEALVLKAESVNINTDSQLLYRQMRRDYKVRHPLIFSLYTQARHLASAFKGFNIKQIPREDNRGADKLATRAVKQALKKTAPVGYLI